MCKNENNSCQVIAEDILLFFSYILNQAIEVHMIQVFEWKKAVKTRNNVN